MKKKISIIFFIILILAVLADLLVPVIIGTKYPGYDHLVDTISSLGANDSPVQIYQCINLIIVGGLLFIFSIGQFILTEKKS